MAFFNNFDKVGDTLEDPKYILSLDGEDDIKYGTNNLDQMSSNSRIHYIIMRSLSINMSKAIEIARESKPILIITDTSACIDSVYPYKVIH